MRRERAIDVIRSELLDQQRRGEIELRKGSKPDAFRVIGQIDIHEIAQAFENEARHA